MDFMESETETSIYEICYLLRGDVDEEKALEISEHLRKAAEDEKGIIVQENKPQKQNIAYPIKKHLTAYCGLLKFIFPIDKIEALKKSIEKNEDVLRLFLTRANTEKENTKRPPRKLVKKPIDVSSKQIQTQQKEGAVAEKDALQVEEIDKKIEEILGQ